MPYIPTPKCPVCREPSLVFLSNLEASKMRHPSTKFAQVQEVFPNWSVDDRELLISGTHHECREKLTEMELG